MKKHPETKKGTYFKGRKKIRKGKEIFAKKAKALFPIIKKSKYEKGKTACFDKRTIKERNELFDKMIGNHEKLKTAGIPVAKIEEIEESQRGLKHANFEHLREISFEEFKKRKGEIADILRKSYEENLPLAFEPKNFGIDKQGNIKVRDSYPIYERHNLEKEIKRLKRMVIRNAHSKQTEKALVLIRMLKLLAKKKK